MTFLKSHLGCTRTFNTHTHTHTLNSNTVSLCILQPLITGWMGKLWANSRLYSFYSHRWSELQPPFSHRRNACGGKDEGKITALLPPPPSPPPSPSPHSVPGHTLVGLFPPVGIPLPLKRAIQILHKKDAAQTTPRQERMWGNAVRAGRLSKPWAQISACLSAPLSLFLPLYSPSLLLGWNLSRALPLAEWPGHVI